MADPQRVDPAGKFVTHRDLVGAAVIDSATLSDANFPPAAALHCADVQDILVYYDDASGGIGTIDVVPLLRDGINAIWLPQPAVQIAGRTARLIQVHGANEVFLRIGVVAGAGANLKLRAAAATYTAR